MLHFRKIALPVAMCLAILSSSGDPGSSQPPRPEPGVPPGPPGPVVFQALTAVAAGDALMPGPYTFDVSDSGDATWRMPLWTPEGRNGIAPQLTITYGSRRGRGLLGKGFTLTGL